MVVIPITDDLIDEPNEIFTVDGTVISGNTTNTNPSGTVTIVDTMEHQASQSQM
jgi:hypothetical protein